MIINPVNKKEHVEKNHLIFLACLLKKRKQAFSHMQGVHKVHSALLFAYCVDSRGNVNRGCDQLEQANP